MRTLGTGPTYDPRRRIGVMVVVIALLVLALVFQLLRIQVIDRDRYVAWGEDQRIFTTLLPGQRGDILDRNGEELAISINTPVIYADPGLIGQPNQHAAALAPVLGVGEDELETTLSASTRFEYLQRPSTELVAEKIRALGLDGVYVGAEPQRFHPNGDKLARGVIGDVGFDNEAISGLEAQLDRSLAGVPGELISERGLNGRTIPEGERQRRPAVDGANITLTLDRALQFEVEKTLSEHVATTGAEAGIVVISEPATGDVLAMATIGRTESGRVVPTSDNRAVIWTYEPASVMKAVTFAGVLNEGLATPQTSRTVSDRLEIYDETFTDDEIYGTRPMSVTDILVRSSNNWTILWADALGDGKFHDYLRSFGFGQPSGLDFPGESRGIFRDLDDWSGTSFATIAIGQGISVTPLQMLMAFNVIANDGLYVAPRLIREVNDVDGPVPVASPSARRVIERDAAEDVTDMLRQVADYGTAQAAAVPGYSIAAKTGTARKAQAETGTYRDAEGNFHHVATVAGFFPADDPQYSMIVILDEPVNEIYASRIAAPLFGELAGWTLRHYQVSPRTDLVIETVGSASSATGAPEKAKRKSKAGRDEAEEQAVGTAKSQMAGAN
ncbi:MAG: peptidoglycan D,D-transpeptidase FtsI family protein [Acidimicrobiales bacterium]